MNVVSNMLIQTKIQQPPIRKDILARQGLYDRLTGGLDKRLTLVTAPAGYGKTTLVNNWLNQVSYPVAWFTLDSHDNDPSRFLSYLIATLNQANLNLDDKLSPEVAASLRSRREILSLELAPYEILLSDILTELAKLEPFTILVLDDFHLINNPTVHAVIEFILQNLPPPDLSPADGSSGCHLVIISRSVPSFPIARWRLHGDLVEINIDDLRISLSEADYILNHIQHMDLSPDNVSALTTHTEGWIAGLQLAALSMKGQKSRTQNQMIHQYKGNNRLIADYLIEEVLLQQPPDIQDFLLATSVLDRMCSDLCAVITENPNSQAILEVLERNNGFVVPLDHERKWYRYHQLFSNVLVNRLESHQPERFAKAHRRAAKWFEENGDHDDSLYHWFAIDDYSSAAQSIENHIPTFLDIGEFSTVRRLLEAFPQMCFEQWPMLSISLAGVYLNLQPELVECWLHIAERALRKSIKEDRYTKEEIDDMQGRIAGIHASNAVLSGNFPKILNYAPQALELLPISNTNVRGTALVSLSYVYFQKKQIDQALETLIEANGVFRLGASYSGLTETLSLIGDIQLAQGQLHAAARSYQEAISLDEQIIGQDIYFTGRSYSGFGMIQFEWNQLEEAQKNLFQGYKLSERMGCTDRVASAVPLVRYYLSQNDLISAGRILREFNPLIGTCQVIPWFKSELIACWLQFLAISGDIQSFHRLALDQNISSDIDFDPIQEPEGMAYALACYLMKDYDTAAMLASKLVSSMAEGGRTGRQIRMLALQAAALKQMNKPQAQSVLAHSIRLSTRERFIRTYLDYGESMLKLIVSISHKSKIEEFNLDSVYLGTLISSFISRSDQEQKVQTFPDNDHPKEIIPEILIDPLTSRENRVLRLLVGELSNQEIAQELGISVNTVKTHIANIYQKLDVHNRLEASNRARQIDLL